MSLLKKFRIGRVYWSWTAWKSLDSAKREVYREELSKEINDMLESLSPALHFYFGERRRAKKKLFDESLFQEAVKEYIRLKLKNGEKEDVKSFLQDLRVIIESI